MIGIVQSGQQGALRTKLDKKTIASLTLSFLIKIFKKPCICQILHRDTSFMVFKELMPLNITCKQPRVRVIN